MTTRRRAAPQDGLDLLLDTICNTFGGVLFIAILVVLLLQETGSQAVDVDQPTIPAEQIQDLRIRLAELNAELTRAKSNQDAQSEIIEQFANDEIRDLLKQRQTLLTEREELESQLDALLSQNAHSAVRVASLETESKNLQQDLAAVTEEKQQLEESIERNRESRTHEARMPLVKPAANKAEIGFILQYGRVYLWHSYDRFNHRDGLNTDDFVIVGEEDGALVTQPKPSGGVKLDGTESSRNTIRRLFGRFKPSEHVLVAIVRPDSFSQFQYFRDAAIEMGFNYRLMPVAKDTGVVDQGGSSSGVQ